MNYVEYGKENNDVIILLHGGGLSWWNYKEVAEILQTDFESEQMAFAFVERRNALFYHRRLLSISKSALFLTIDIKIGTLGRNIRYELTSQIN